MRVKIILYIFLILLLSLALIAVMSLFNLSKNEDIKAELSGNVFNLEIASDFVSRMNGLSGRKRLIDNDGMLFIFNKSGGIIHFG